jgi:translation initiation factor 1
MAKKGSWTDDDAAGDSPFSALARLREALPEAPPAKPAPATPPTAEKKPIGPARAVVRIERKGRGGKDATIIAHLGLSAPELEVWAKALKAQLGCGGAVEGDEIVLQGDLRKRVGPLLEARGVRKVTMG